VSPWQGSSRISSYAYRALKRVLNPLSSQSILICRTFLRREGSQMWVWVTDQLWTFICIGIAGGIAGAIYQSRRPSDLEISPAEAHTGS
jgi:hypothetical protein